MKEDDGAIVGFLRQEAATCFDLSRVQKTKADATSFLRKSKRYEAAAEMLTHPAGDSTMRTNIEQMLAEAERAYQSAAASHAMGKVSHAGGKIAALKDVLKLMDCNGLRYANEFCRGIRRCRQG